MEQQQQQQQRHQQSGSAASQRAGGAGGYGNTQPHVRQASRRFDSLHGGSRSRSPLPRFPGAVEAPSTRSPPHAHSSRTRQPSRRFDGSSPPPHSQQHTRQQRQPSQQQSPLSQQYQQQRTPSMSFDRRSRRVVGDREVCDGWWQRTDSPSAADARAASASASNPHHGASSGRMSGAHGYTRRLSPSGNSPDEERRRSQREKQIQYGYVTDGYTNMERLIAHDPLLQSGGILPLSPPAIVKGSKRLWDIQLRKWRRALHMFDHVFIDGEDDPAARAAVLEEQRLQWVSEAFHDVPREGRVRIDLDTLRRVQTSAAVPRKIPVEDDLRCILRRDDCYESVRSVVPQSASSLTKGTDISPLEAGIKIHVAPSAAVLQRQQAQLEMQQRLSSLHQQQTAAAAAAAAEGVVSGRTDADAVPLSPAAEASTAAQLKCPSPSAPRDGTWRQQQEQSPGDYSPSPRRPPAASSLVTFMTPLRVFGASPPHSESAVTPSQQRTRYLSEAVAEITEHARKHCDDAGRQSGSPAPLNSAAAVGGLSASQPRVSSASGSPAPAWSTTRTAAAAESLPTPSVPLSTVLAPPPPLPSTRTTGATRTSAASAGCSVPAPSQLWTMAGQPSLDSMLHPVPCCSHCGHAVWGPTAAAVAASGGGFLFHDARGGGGTGTFASSMVFPNGAPYVPDAAFSPGPCVPGQPSPSAASRPFPHHQTQSSTTPTQPLYAAPGTREARRRGGAAAAAGMAGTPQTVPRFVARVSSSPSEQRLGDCWGEAAAAHAPRPQHSISPLATSPAALQPSPANTRVAETTGSVVQAAEQTVRAEKGRSLVAVTPERALFDAGVIAEGVSTEVRQLHGRRSLGSPSPQHFDPLRDSPFGKPGALTDAEDFPVVPLVFDTDV